MSTWIRVHAELKARFSVKNRSAEPDMEGKENRPARESEPHDARAVVRNYTARSPAWEEVTAIR